MAQPVRVRRLTDQEGQKLQQTLRRGSTNSVRYRRAMMLLASAGGNRVPVIAQLVQADEDTVRDVIHRFNEIGLACLDPRWAGGRPRRLSPDEEDFVIQTATTRPTKLGQPFTRWSLRKLAAYLRKVHGRVIRIGREALRCLLRRRGITFQRPRPGRSHPTLIATPSSTGSSRCWNASRTGSSPSPSSGPWESGPPQAPAGRSRASQTGCRRPTAAPTASPTSTAATPWATTPVGRQPPLQGHRQHPGRAQVDPRRPTRRRPDLHHPGQPLRPHRRGHPPLGEEEQGRAVLHPDLHFLGQPDRGPLRPAAVVHPGQLPPPQPPCANPGSAPLPALAQHQRPPPRRTRRPTQGTRPHPQRKGHSLGRTPPRHRGLTNREQQPPNADGASSGEGQRQKDDSGGERLDLPREDDDLVDEAPSEMDDIRSRQAGASIRRGEDPLVPGPFVRHVHR